MLILRCQSLKSLCLSFSVSMDSSMLQDDFANNKISGASRLSAPDKDVELHSTQENGVFNVPVIQGSQKEEKTHLEQQSKQKSPLSNGQRPIAKISDTIAFTYTENSSSSRPTLVHGVSLWNFPVGTLDKSKFVFDSLREGFDAKVVTSNITPLTHPRSQPRQTRKTRKRQIQYNEKALEDNIIGAEEKDKRPPFGSPRSRRRINEDPTFEKKSRPKATGVEFDTRFLSFALAPDGSRMEEKLVWCIGKNSNDISFDSREATMEKILDLPKRCRESLSRVGPIYQARIPERVKPGINILCYGDEPPGYDKIWDPKLAESAEKEGQDINGYLQKGTMIDLCKTEFLMKLLHENNYNVERATNDMNKVQRFRGCYKLNKRRELEDDWCAYQDGKCKYADDEHTLVVCDGCGRAYHLECAKLDRVPSGEWFCPVCHLHFIRDSRR